MDCHNNIHNPQAGLHQLYKTIDDRPRTTRKTGMKFMKVPNIKSSMGRRAYSFQGPSFWNKLDDESKCIEDKNAFKRHISKLVCQDVNHPG